MMNVLQCITLFKKYYGIKKGGLLIIIDKKNINFTTNDNSEILEIFYKALIKEYREDKNKNIFLIKKEDIEKFKKVHSEEMISKKSFIKELSFIRE